MSKAARLAGDRPDTLYRLMEKHGFRREGLAGAVTSGDSLGTLKAPRSPTGHRRRSLSLRLRSCIDRATATPRSSRARPTSSRFAMPGPVLEYRASVRTKGRKATRTSGPWTCGPSSATPASSACSSYDPAFMNTASCRSAITFIDGDKGILRYRGYPIEQLAEKATFLEVAYLLRHGELPDAGAVRHVGAATSRTTRTCTRTSASSSKGFATTRTRCRCCAARRRRCRASIRRRATSTIRSSATSRSSACIAKLPTMAAFAYRHVKGLPFIYPDNDLSYVENFLSMVARMSEPQVRGAIRCS